MMRNIQTRNGFEFWDKLNALPRYAFLLSPSGKSVQKLEDQAMGNWIDVHEAQKIVDQAQELISELQKEVARQKRYVQINGDSAQGKHAEGQRYRDERDALQQRLNAADQTIDDLKAQLTAVNPMESRMITLSGCEFTEHELLRTAVRMVTGTSRRGTQRWVAMKDAFCCGSGVAHALCRRFGYDPDETVKP